MRGGLGAGVVLTSPKRDPLEYVLQIHFKASNNVVEYEALLLGLQTAKNLNIECLTIYGDSKLVVWKIGNQYQAKQPRLRTYRNEVWDLI